MSKTLTQTLLLLLLTGISVPQSGALDQVGAKPFIRCIKQNLTETSVPELLQAHEKLFEHTFSAETGLDGRHGLQTTFDTIDGRRAHMEMVVSKYGPQYEPHLRDVEKFIQSLRSVAEKLEHNEYEFVVFFDSVGPPLEVLNGGTVKNYFETGKTSGNYSTPERLKVEASLLGIEPTEYKNHFPEEMRPKYGIIRLKGAPDPMDMSRVARSYGAHAMVFDGAQLAKRMTFSLGDSYDRVGGYVTSNRLSPIKENLEQKIDLPSWSFGFIPWSYRKMMAMFAVGLHDKSPTFRNPKSHLIPEFKQFELGNPFGLWYFEGQVWGKLDQKELIGYEYYPNTPNSKAPTADFLNALKKAGVPVEVIK